MNGTTHLILRHALFRPRGASAADNALLAHAAVVLLSLATFLSLFVFRALDDNRLTSWQWVFADADLFRVTPILCAGLLLAYALSRIPHPGALAARWLFVVSFAVGMLSWSEPEVIVDVARYFTQAKHVEIYGVGNFLTEWGGQISAWTDLPLVPLLYGLIFSLLGEERVYIQIFTTLLFSGSVVLTYLIGKTLWDEAVGIYAGLLLLGMPYLLAQVPLMLVDVPTMFFLTLAVFMTIQALTQGGIRHTALAALAVALAGCTKYSTWLMLSVLPVAVVALHWSHQRKLWLRGGVLAAASLVLTASALFPILDVIIEQLGLLQSYQAPGLKRWEESFTSTFLFQIHPFITGAALFSAYAAFKRRDSRYAIILWLPLLLVLLEIKRIRYLLPLFPMLALMAAYGLREILNGEVRKHVVLSIVMSSMVIVLTGFLPFTQKASAANLKQAGEYLDSLAGEEVDVFVLPQLHALVNPVVSVPILDLFTHKHIVLRQDPIAAPSEETLSQSSLRFTWGYRSPAYYDPVTDDTGGNAKVVIASDPAQPLSDSVGNRLKEYRLSREFAVSEQIFGYQTIVKVYLPAQKSTQK